MSDLTIQNNIADQEILPDVFVYHDGVYTDSLKVAEYFHKRHKNIIRDIENLECSKEFNELNFEPIKYKDSRGRFKPAYRITKDGFVFLVMGFTGKKAAAFKEAYIKRFNEMEKWLLARIENKQTQDFFADAVKRYEERQPPKYRRPHAYSIENNLVYIVALGATRKQWLANHGYREDDEIRPHLTFDQLKRLDLVLSEAMRLLNTGVFYKERKQKLQQFVTGLRIEQLKGALNGKLCSTKGARE